MAPRRRLTCRSSDRRIRGSGFHRGRGRRTDRQTRRRGRPAHRVRRIRRALLRNRHRPDSAQQRRRRRTCSQDDRRGRFRSGRRTHRLAGRSRSRSPTRRTSQARIPAGATPAPPRLPIPNPRDDRSHRRPSASGSEMPAHVHLPGLGHRRPCHERRRRGRSRPARAQPRCLSPAARRPLRSRSQRRLVRQPS